MPASHAAAPTAFRSIAPGAAGAPLYREVKRALLRAIEAGSCRPGHTLPSETALAGAFGVSIGTLRKAVDELVAEHLLVRRHGRGTFVATHGADRFLVQFFHVERRDGLREVPDVDLVSFERLRCDPESAQTLGEPAHSLGLRVGDAVICIENRLRLQGRAVVYDRLTLPASLFRGLTEKRLRERPGTIYQFYQSEFGITVLRALERARATAADRATARVLGVPAGLPMMQVDRTALSFGDRPVEHRVSVIDTRHHDYVNLLSKPAARHE